MDAVEGDVAFSADLGIGTARAFEVDGEFLDWVIFHIGDWGLILVFGKWH